MNEVRGRYDGQMIGRPTGSSLVGLDILLCSATSALSASLRFSDGVRS